MAKQPIYWTIYRNYGVFSTMAVTSEDGRQLYGRDMGAATHRRRDDCYGRFETEEAANEKRGALRALMAEYKHKRGPLKTQLEEINSQERTAINLLLRSISPSDCGSPRP